MSDQNDNSNLSSNNLTRTQKFVTGLTIFTALSHIIFSYGWENSILGINVGIWFVLNGVGYLSILYFLYFGKQYQSNRDTLRMVLAAWILGSIMMWALFHTSSSRYDTLLDASLINKSVEILILIFLYLDNRSLGT